jgi:hypothetical protein
MSSSVSQIKKFVINLFKRLIFNFTKRHKFSDEPLSFLACDIFQVHSNDRNCVFLLIGKKRDWDIMFGTEE